MRTRSVLSVAAAASAAVVVAVIAGQGSATPRAAATANGSANQPSAATATNGHGRAQPSPTAAGSRTTPTEGATTATNDAYPPPTPGRYTYGAPGGDTVTQVTVSPTGPVAWRLDESVIVKSALVQRRQEAWTAGGARVLAVWEAGQAQPCVWSTPPTDVAFPLRATSRWSVDASCKVVNGTAGQSVTHVKGSFRTTGPVRLTIAGHATEAWLVTGTETTTVDGKIRGHSYHTIDHTTTREWFLPSIGLPGRTELTGTVAITTEKGTTRHRIGQLTQLKSLTPQ